MNRETIAACVEVASPVGRLRLLADETALVALLFAGEGIDRVRLDVEVPKEPLESPSAHPILALAARELESYFAGTLREFTVPLRPFGTDFQKRAWQALCRIPFGETRSYGEQAALLGDAKASRAVGAANGRNPLAIVVPCHRVIGSGGALVGFGGGLPVKRWLLEHERQVTTPRLFAEPVPPLTSAAGLG